MKLRTSNVGPRTSLRLPVPVADFSSRLLSWYRRERRELPWRTDPTPYRVWLSEIMLQQTQVKTALPYFERFLRIYPNIAELARADEDHLLSLWAGLGYYSRARNLLKAARIIVQRHGGSFPDDWNQARELPGVGRYTAGAVLSIGYGQPHPILDGNIRRFLARYLRQEPESNADLETFWSLLDTVVHDPAVVPVVADFNQALMELGALLCTPRNPVCATCPLEASCRARLGGVEHDIPQLRSGRAGVSLEFVVAVIANDGEFLMRQNGEAPFPQGFWEFPRVEGAPRAGIERDFQTRHGIALKVVKACRPVRHQITFRKLRFHPLICTLKAEPKGPWVWTAIGRPGFPMPSYVAKIGRRVGL